MLHSPLHYAPSHLSPAPPSLSPSPPLLVLLFTDSFDPGAAADAHRGQAKGVLGAPEGRGRKMAILGGGRKQTCTLASDGPVLPPNSACDSNSGEAEVTGQHFYFISYFIFF